MIRLMIVDDHVLFRQGLSSLFRQHPDFEVLGEAGDVREAIALALDLQPEVILMDFSLPDGTGLDATQAILRKMPETQIIFLTMHEEDDRLFAAIRSGARGYLLKNLPVNKLIDSLKGLARGETVLSHEMTSRIIREFSRLGRGESERESSALQELTDRELEVFDVLSKGYTNQEIADELFISIHTVKNHVHNILEKLELKNRREVARYAAQRGLTKNK